MRIISTEEYNNLMKMKSNYLDLLLKPLQGAFEKVTDDDLLRENGLLYAENERLKEEYVMLQNASDEVEDEKDREIGRLTAESTKWESKFYDEAKKVDKAIEKIESIRIYGLRSGKTLFATLLNEILDILKGVDKE